MGGEDVTSSAPRLDYAQRPPRLTRKRVRGLVLLTIGVAMIAVGTVWWDDAESAVARWNRRRQINALQAKCMAYVPPDGQVVYEEDGSRAAPLRASSPEYQIIASHGPDAEGRLVPATRPGAPPLPVMHVPRLWAAYTTFDPSSQALPSFRQQGLVFMHERSPVSAGRRLVTVELAVRAMVDERGTWSIRRGLSLASVAPGSHKPGRFVSVSIIAAGTGEADRVRWMSAADLAGESASPPFPMRLYAGRVDPADASRFTIDYELQGIGHRGTVVCVLKDDGGVSFSPDAGEVRETAVVTGGEILEWRLPTTRSTSRPQSR